MCAAEFGAAVSIRLAALGALARAAGCAGAFAGDYWDAVGRLDFVFVGGRCAPLFTRDVVTVLRQDGVDCKY